MTRRRFLLVAGLILAACVGMPRSVPSVSATPDTLPEKLTDAEFWKIISDFSEPNGYFRSDNLLSNEIWYQYVIPELTRIAKPSRLYLGVGPEQNFAYIVALTPKMVFIVDVRRGNLHLHLMYKALFELSKDRAEFVSRLFSKKRPEGLDAKSTVGEIFSAFANMETSEELYKQNLKDILDLLGTRHGFDLSADDRQGIEYVYHAFYWYGPGLTYSSTGGRGGRNQPNYADLMVAADGSGKARGYLATEENFGVLKNLETKNLLVPVVGNFAGPKAIRAIGKYLKEKEAVVSAFYLSNVEQYLNQDGIWYSFCGNVATLPLDESSTFIRSVRGGGYGRSFGLDSALGNMASEVKGCAARDR
jgi:hypothetical protein